MNNRVRHNKERAKFVIEIKSKLNQTPLYLLKISLQNNRVSSNSKKKTSGNFGALNRVFLEGTLSSKTETVAVK